MVGIMPPKQKKSKPAQPPAKQGSRKQKKAKKKMPQSAPGTVSQLVRGLKTQENHLACAMALPYDSKQVRFPTVDMPRTSTMVTRDQFTLTCSSVTPPGFDLGDLLVAFYGQPGRMLMYFDAITPGGTYVAEFAETTSSFDKIAAVWFPFNNTFSTNTVVNAPWPLFSLKGVGAAPHGPVCPIGYSKHGDFVWLNSGDSLTVSGSGNFFPTGTIEYEVRQWQSADSEPTLAQEGVWNVTNGVEMGQQILPNLGQGYFALRIVSATITAGSISPATGFKVTIVCNATLGWTIKTQSAINPGLSGDPVIGLNARVNAASLLMTNTTSILNRQGTVLAARLQEVDPSNVTSAVLQRAAEKYTGDAAKGVYTFKEFTPYSESFRRHTATASGSSGSIFYDMDYNDFYHFIQISCPTVATSANTFTVSSDLAMEFRSDVERYPKDVATDVHTALVEARRLINGNPVWFYENPLHMAQIYNLIQRGVRGLRRGIATYGPSVAHVASVVDPAHAMGYETLARLMRSLNV